MANSGERGRELYQRRLNEIVAVLLAMVMPGMHGRHVFLGLRTLNANAKLIISSGCGQDGNAGELLKLGSSGSVQKLSDNRIDTGGRRSIET